MNEYEVIWEQLGDKHNGLMRFYEDNSLVGSLYLTAEFVMPSMKWVLLGEHDGERFCELSMAGTQDEALQHLTELAQAFYSGLTETTYEAIK